MIRRLPECPGGRFHGGGGRAPRRGEASPSGQPAADHSRHQAVHRDGLAIKAETQQRPFVQPLQRLVYHGRGDPAPAAEQRARLPGSTQQVAADHGRRQHGHGLHHSSGHADRVGSPRGLQGQQHRFGHARRVRQLLPVLPPDQVIPDRQRPQLGQVRRVPQVLPGDHRRCLVQGQRQIPQFGSHRRGAGFIGQTGPPDQQGLCLLGAEHVYLDGFPQLRDRLPGHADQYPGRASRRDERPQQTGILRVIEHQQAAASVSLQPAPDRLAWVNRAMQGTAIRQSRGFGHRGQPRQQSLAVPSVDPCDQPPAARQPGPRVRGRQLGLAHSPGTREHYRRSLSGPIQSGQQSGPGLETGPLPRDITDDDLVIRHRRRRRFPGLRLRATSRRLMTDRRIHCQTPMRIPGPAQLTAVRLRLRTSTYPPQQG